MFPLADARGRVVGFGARAMRDDQPPKYLNTSEGEVFHKGSQLFGIDLARKAAARAGSIVLAEGYTDVLALHQAGIENAVGIMGTSFTDEQARELERTARTLVLALDADGAGQEAMLRAARVAEGRSMELRVVALPAGLDPADLVQQEGVEAVRARIGRSRPVRRVPRRARPRARRARHRGGEGPRAGGAAPAARLRCPRASCATSSCGGSPGGSTCRDQLAASLIAGERARTASVAAGARHRAAGPATAASAPPRRPRPARPPRARRAHVPRALRRVPARGQSAAGGGGPASSSSAPTSRAAPPRTCSRTSTPRWRACRTTTPSLATFLSDLDARAARGGSARPGNLEHAWLSLELARLERAIDLARHCRHRRRHGQQTQRRARAGPHAPARVERGISEWLARKLSMFFN